MANPILNLQSLHLGTFLTKTYFANVRDFDKCVQNLNFVYKKKIVPM